MFDQANRMKSAVGKATYAYAGLGHRVSVVGVDGVNRVQVYSQGGQLLYAGPSGGIGAKYVYLHNHVLAEVGVGGTTYDHTDGLGSPVAQSNAAGAVVSRTVCRCWRRTEGVEICQRTKAQEYSLSGHRRLLRMLASGLHFSY